MSTLFPPTRCFPLPSREISCEVWLILWILARSNVEQTLWSETVILQPSADTTLIQTVPNNNLGGQKFFNAGITQNGTTNRALLRFDLAAIPSRSTIKTVNLILEVTGQPKDGFESTSFHLHRVLKPWGEGNKIIGDLRSPGLGAPATPGEATWNHRFAFTTNTWTIPGGAAGDDYSEILSAEQAIYDIGSSPYTFYSTTQSTADVQIWLDEPQNNFGWLLKAADESTPFTARRFASRENPDFAPRAIIEYEPPLQIDSAGIVSNRFELSFTLRADYSYAVEFRDSLSTEGWTILTNFRAENFTTNRTVFDTLSTKQRYYRLREE